MSLTASGIHVSYDGRPVLTEVSVSLEPGRTIGLFGPSGVGKSTLALALAGLLTPDAGRVTLDGAPIETRRGRMAGRVAMLFQSPRRACNPRQRLGAMVAEPLRYRRRSPADREATVASLVREVGLTHDLLSRLPAEVSDGQLQRAALARTLAAEPAYLICDEATAMLDPISTASVVGVLRRRSAEGLGVLAISHDRELLEMWADELIGLDAPANGEVLRSPTGLTDSSPFRRGGSASARESR